MYAMNTQTRLSTSSPNLVALTPAEKKKLPFYTVTADPFGAMKKWENLLKDTHFMEALQ